MGLAKNSFLYLVSNVLIKAASFFLLPLYSYLVPPEVYGHIYVVSALSNFVSILLPLSMVICISRFYFDCKTVFEVKKLYSTIVLFSSISSAILITPMFLCSDWLADFINIPSNYFIAGLLISYFSCYYQIIMALLYVCQKAKVVSITSALVGVGHVILQLALVLSLDDKGLALLSTMLIQSISTFILFLVFSKPYLTLHFDFKSTGKFLKYSFSQFPSDVSGWLVNFTDRVFINKYINSNSAGVYGIGANIGQIPMMVFSSVNSAFTPYVNSQYKAMETVNDYNLQIIKKNLSYVFMVVSSIMLMLMSIMIVLSNNIISILSPAYMDAFLIVIVMLMASLMNNYRCMFMAPLAYNIKYTKIKSLIWVVAGIINVVLNFYLIPLYGIYAACANSLITYTITFLLMLYYGRKAIYVKYEWTLLIKVFIVSMLYCSLLVLGNGIEWFFLKLFLMIPYIHVCIFCILKINIYKKIKTYVKIFCNK